MYSKGHAVVSALVGALGAVVLGVDASEGALLVGLAVVLGVGIDFDHFVIARLNAGDWRAVRACLRDPTMVFTDQSAIFRDGEVTTLQRLLSHHLIGGVLVVVITVASLDIGLFTAVVLYAHVVSDLLWDVRGWEATQVLS